MEEKNKNKGGRPKKSEPTKVIGIRVPLAEYDRLFALATEMAESLSEYIYHLVKTSKDRTRSEVEPHSAESEKIHLKSYRKFKKEAAAARLVERRKQIAERRARAIRALNSDGYSVSGNKIYTGPSGKQYRIIYGVRIPI